MGAFQPDPMLINFILLKEFVYLPVLAVLALVRGLVGVGRSRQAGFVALALAVLGAAVVLGPSLGGLQGGPLVAAAITLGNMGGGMVLPLLASAPMLVSALVPGARGRWIDVLHLCLLSVLLVLWVMAR